MIRLSDDKLISVMTEEIRQTLTDLWIKQHKEATIAAMEASIARQQTALAELKAEVSVKPEEPK